MKEKDIESLNEIVSSGVNNVYTGASILIGKNEKLLYKNTYGTKDEKEKLTEEDIFDLASVTKVVGTATAVMKLIDEKQIKLEDKIGKFIEVSSPKSEITIFELLTHTSGIQAYSNLWEKYQGEELLKQIINIQPQENAYKCYEYSCLNFITLMKIVEEVTQKHFKEYVEDIFKKIRMENTCFNPKNQDKAVSTSIREGKRLKGVVEDELAYYLGGVSGNAGLFSNTGDLRVFIISLLSGEIVSKDTLDLFTTTLVKRGENTTHIAWMAPPVAGCQYSLDSTGFGHNGFTGTSIWIRKDGLFSIFLTNSVYYDRFLKKPELNVIRNKINNIIFRKDH
ncbi:MULTISPECIES: serine hydrolase [Petrotoga]|uniref:CubicO group peptidase (Beta-lactamase class C family) n=1 Tax=Petrotoga sibirica TaxID=156202 RepID=A0A4R8EU74_9BACT|nr:MULTISPECIES: serine hydrolase domain-containing protein [Petrotoga]TDX13191.1 CubicO group peptidase (beta-lactamase class C family) [Petrotoga sibirica]